jgi:hypothetical protein
VSGFWRLTCFRDFLRDLVLMAASTASSRATVVPMAPASATRSDSCRYEGGQPCTAHSGGTSAAVPHPAGSPASLRASRERARAWDFQQSYPSHLLVALLLEAV